MGNEISHKRYCCRKSRKFERPATVQENTVVDLPVAQTALGAVLWSIVNHPPKEKSQDTATGMKNKDVGRESEITSSSLPVAQIMVRTTELQDLGEAQPSAEQSEETENKPATMMSPDRQTCAPTQERPATAQQAEGDTGVTTDLPLQTAMETGARDVEDVVTDQATVESNSVVRERPTDKLCKPSPLCRWLRKLRSPEEKAKVRPDAITSQE
ncbi:hypothetical protein QYF61_008924 [Mycteria americana]|uniref:Uncharacterized protein n=1 Tax=Mycteria americana TaxID=33587 RepID=A0AAN7RM57_MYCAM|nr:hypothetical protein QYF61_008924 [Mycteria americana]